MKQIIFSGRVSPSWSQDQALTAAHQALDEDTYAAVRESISDGREVILAECSTAGEAQREARCFRQAGLEVTLNDGSESGGGDTAGTSAKNTPSPETEPAVDAKSSDRSRRTGVVAAAIAVGVIALGTFAWYGGYGVDEITGAASGNTSSDGVTQAEDTATPQAADGDSEEQRPDLPDGVSISKPDVTDNEAIPEFAHWGNADPYHWQQGPFGARILSSGLTADGTMTVPLRVVGRELPNVVADDIQMKYPRLRLEIEDVVDEQGASLCPSSGCVKGSNADAQPFDESAEKSVERDDGQESYRYFAIEPTIELAEGASVNDVAAIKLNITHKRPAGLTTYRVTPSAAEKTIEADGVTVHFGEIDGRNVSYGVTGDEDKLEAIRAVDEANEPLERQSRNWRKLGEGPKQYQATYDGEIAAIEYTVASRFEERQYTFEIPSGLPYMGSDDKSPSSTWVETEDEPALKPRMDSEPPDASAADAPDHATKAGPARLYVDRLGVNKSWGLYGRIEVIASETLPMYRLNALALRLDEAVTPTGERVALDALIGVVLGGAITKPGLYGDADVGIESYQDAKPKQLKGELVFRDAVGTSIHEMDAAVGTTSQAHGVSIQVARWLHEESFSAAITLKLEGQTERLVKVAALNADGDKVGSNIRTLKLGEAGGELSFFLNGEPQTLRIMTAAKTPTFTKPFTLTVPDK